MSDDRLPPEEEIQIASRCMDWFDLLAKLRKAADMHVSADALMEQIRRIDPNLLEFDRLSLKIILTHYFERRGRQREAQVRVAAVRKEELRVDVYVKAMLAAGKSAERGYKKSIIRELAKLGVTMTKPGLIKWEKRHCIPPVRRL